MTTDRVCGASKNLTGNSSGASTFATATGAAGFGALSSSSLSEWSCT